MRFKLFPRSPILPVVVALLFAASACTSQAEPTAIQGSPQPVAIDGSPELAAGQGHQFGASLDEFFDGSAPDAPASTPPPDGFAEITWEDLVPPGSSGAEISARFNERIALVEPGSPEADEVFAELQAEYSNQPPNPELAGDDILLAGFIAPLTYSGDLITEFLLVPYFGACIHVPPPPANQTVLVSLAEGEGVTIDESWGAIWVTGTMNVDTANTDLATAAYSISGASSGVYNQF